MAGEGARFDDLARALAQGRSRRSVLLALAGTLFSAACGAVSKAIVTGTSTNPSCVQVCTGDNMKLCVHDCSGNNNTSCLYNCTGSNASACQHDCAGPNSTNKCTSNCYTDIPNCPSGQTACVGACVDPQTDRHNCGQCGNVCPTDQQCRQGECAAG